MENLPYIGQLQYPITIEREVKGRTTTGEESATSYETVLDLKAKLSRQNGNDDVEGKVRTLIDRSYIVRFRSELLEDTDTLYVVDGTERYRIYNVRELKRKRWLEILVTQYE